MAFYPLDKLLQDAMERKYAVGQFTVTCLSMIEPVIEAAKEEDAPIMLTTHYDWNLKSSAGVNAFREVVRAYGESAGVPVVLHLDHGEDLHEVLECIRGGFNSVMYDGTGHPFDENIRLTKSVVDLAHAVDIAVEGEIDKCPTLEEAIPTTVPEELLTKPELAKRFVEETGVDILAVAVGQVHHHPKLVGDVHPLPKISSLNFERLKAIRKATNAFLTMHASTHTPEDQIKKAIQLGVTKIGVGHIVLAPFVDGIRKTLKDSPDLYWPHEVLEPARRAIKKIVKHELQVYGSSGKAEGL